MRKLKRKLRNLKLKPKYFVMLLICMLMIGYSALEIGLYINGQLNVAVNEEDKIIYISYVGVNGNYVFTEHTSMEDLSLENNQQYFVFDTNLLRTNTNNISYRIMNKSTQYDIENAHIVCSDSTNENDQNNYTFVDLNASDNGGLINAQTFRDGNISVSIDHEVEDTISCVLMYNLKERLTSAPVVEMDETPTLSYNASQVGYTKDGYPNIETVEDALNYLYEELGPINVES